MMTTEQITCYSKSLDEVSESVTIYMTCVVRFITSVILALFSIVPCVPGSFWLRVLFAPHVCARMLAASLHIVCTTRCFTTRIYFTPLPFLTLFPLSFKFVLIRNTLFSSVFCWQLHLFANFNFAPNFYSWSILPVIHPSVRLDTFFLLFRIVFIRSVCSIHFSVESVIRDRSVGNASLPICTPSIGAPRSPFGWYRHKKRSVYSAHVSYGGYCPASRQDSERASLSSGRTDSDAVSLSGSSVWVPYTLLL